jgi:hypothetical protein
MTVGVPAFVIVCVLAFFACVIVSVLVLLTMLVTMPVLVL